MTYQILRRAVAPEIFEEDDYSTIDTTTDVTFIDTTVENAVTYHYALVAIDGEAFESRWSNFNEDCEGAATDCIEVTPLKRREAWGSDGVHRDGPGCRQPSSAVMEPESGGGYRGLHRFVGTTPGVYTDSVTIEGQRLTGQAPPTQVGIAGLAEGQRVYFSIVAVNYSGLSSDPAGEISDFPVFAPIGIRPPLSSTRCC